MLVKEASLLFNLSPIAFFVYNRPSHTILSLEKLLENNLAKYSDIIIFSDAARNKLDEINVILVRKIIHNISGFRSKKIFYRKQNFGLAKNFINGISLVCKKYEKVIVLEDPSLYNSSVTLPTPSGVSFSGNSRKFISTLAPNL